MMKVTVYTPEEGPLKEVGSLRHPPLQVSCFRV